eukprot:6399009-Karenia_brevis.AAC.1
MEPARLRSSSRKTAKKASKEGYECCVVFWYSNEMFGKRQGIKWWLDLTEETEALKEQMSRFQYRLAFVGGSGKL